MTKLAKATVRIVTGEANVPALLRSHHALWQGDTEALLRLLPAEPIFDLVVTSPPYNLGKSYEKRTDLADYLAWQIAEVGNN
jgi:adenine-specific DNA-methyltransferase